VTQPPYSMYPDGTAASRAYEAVHCEPGSRDLYRIEPELIDTGEISARHAEEHPLNCARSRRDAAGIARWNHPDDPYPITVVEFNWVDDGVWRRAYADFSDGCHRVERALAERLDALWVQVSEYRFMPKGERPADRASVHR
jgi:hypothetical protein